MRRPVMCSGQVAPVVPMSAKVRGARIHAPVPVSVVRGSHPASRCLNHLYVAQFARFAHTAHILHLGICAHVV